MHPAMTALTTIAAASAAASIATGTNSYLGFHQRGGQRQERHDQQVGRASGFAKKPNQQQWKLARKLHLE